MPSRLPPIHWKAWEPGEAPDPGTALAAPIAAFPGWYLMARCATCRHEGQISTLHLPEERLVRDVIARFRCRKCGARADIIELIDAADHPNSRPKRRIRLVGIGSKEP